MSESVKPTIGLRGVPSWIIVAVCLVLVALGAFIYWNTGQERDKDQALARVVLEAPTLASEDALKKCFAGEDGGGGGLLPNADKAWKDTASGDRGYSPPRHLFIDLIPASSGFTVRVLTRDGAALSADDRKIAQRCIGE
ncbi:hypothetical protein [Sphingobium nicotianae]|uniref:Uncharacterized protein n=1 Tax=Sphingobium nicotianae TaxID=2782607 RepID=A0A9X1DEI0_9SPHN|nr:hypothetical protein [Sphingobium nicotianae]MBT2188073.1 hypothetical protein [Sphingobium nicotianae]